MAIPHSRPSLMSNVRTPAVDEPGKAGFIRVSESPTVGVSPERRSWTLELVARWAARIDGDKRDGASGRQQPWVVLEALRIRDVHRPEVRVSGIQQVVCVICDNGARNLEDCGRASLDPLVADQLQFQWRRIRTP